MAGETVLDLDLETNSWAKYPALQGSPGGTSRQFQVVTTPNVSGWGGYTGRLECGPSDQWQDGSYRALACNYGTGENIGQTYWFAFWWNLPTQFPSGTLLWELHHANVLSTANGGLRSLAPHALHVRNGGLYWRLVGGYASANQGYPYWEPNIPIPGLETQPVGEAIWFKVKIRFQEMSAYDSNTGGTVDVYWRTASDTTYWSSPALSRSGVSTLPYDTTQNVHASPLYQCIGVYPGQNQPSSALVAYTGGTRRRLSEVSAEAAFTQYTSPTDPPSSEPHVGNWVSTGAVQASTDGTPPVINPDQYISDWVLTGSVDTTSATQQVVQATVDRYRHLHRDRRGGPFQHPYGAPTGRGKGRR